MAEEQSQVESTKDALLNSLEAEADAMTPGAQPESPEPAPVPEQQFPEEAFDATHDMIVGGIKMALKKYPNGDKAGEVWESPFFKSAVVPVLKKYNLTIYNLPVELVLFGAILTLAKQTADIIRDGQEKAAAKG